MHRAHKHADAFRLAFGSSSIPGKHLVVKSRRSHCGSAASSIGAHRRSLGQRMALRPVRLWKVTPCILQDSETNQPVHREASAFAIYRYSIYDIYVIQRFKDAETEKIFNGLRSRKFAAIAKVAYRKLAILHSAATLHDLKSPGLHLEALREDRAGQHSIRINDRYRICFAWHDGKAVDVEIVDYH
jgi:toxin HigB-1